MTITEITRKLENARINETTYAEVVKPVRQWLAGYNGSLRGYLTDRVEWLEAKLMDAELM